MSTRTGMSITFKSGGYRAVGLYVSCTNPQTGKTDTEVVGVNTTPESCALLLSKACASVGYSSPVKGANVEILGKGMVVKAVGPVFDKKDF